MPSAYDFIPLRRSLASPSKGFLLVRQTWRSRPPLPSVSFIRAALALIHGTELDTSVVAPNARFLGGTLLIYWRASTHCHYASPLKWLISVEIAVLVAPLRPSTSNGARPSNSIKSSFLDGPIFLAGAFSAAL